MYRQVICSSILVAASSLSVVSAFDLSEFQYSAGVQWGLYQFNQEDSLGQKSNGSGLVPSFSVSYPFNRTLKLGTEIRYASMNAQSSDQLFNESVNAFDLAVFAKNRFSISRSLNAYPAVGFETGYATYKTRYLTDKDGYLEQKYSDSDLTVDVAITAGVDIFWEDRKNAWGAGPAVLFRQSLNGGYRSLLVGLKITF